MSVIPGSPAPPPAPAASQPAPITPKDQRRPHTLARDAIEVLIIALVLYVVISLAFQTVRVDGSSMQPTLQSEDFLIASRISYRLHDPERGDIAVFQPPTDPTKDFIKRVIAIPGDQIEILPPDPAAQRPSTELLLRIGGQGPWELVHEQYLLEPWTDNTDCCAVPTAANGGAAPALLVPDGSTPQPFTIPKDQYFMMGDNRNHSEDSRLIGLIPRDHIFAKAFLRILPVRTIGPFGTSPTLVPQAILPIPLVMRRRRRITWDDPPEDEALPSPDAGEPPQREPADPV